MKTAKLRTGLTAGVAIGAVLMLGGCSVFRSLGIVDAKPKTQQASVQVPLAPAEGYTAVGRSQLDQGNYGLALETFQRALGNGEPRAAALNGLGVGYARIGRTDLAAQYFRMAMDAEPANERYAANLSTLMKTHAFQETLPRQALAPVRTAPVAAPAEPPRGRLVRVSPREFQIRVAAAPRPDKAQTARLEKDFRPVVRIRIARKDKPAEPAAAAPASAPEAAPKDAAR